MEPLLQPSPRQGLRRYRYEASGQFSHRLRNTRLLPVPPYIFLYSLSILQYPDPIYVSEYSPQSCLPTGRFPHSPQPSPTPGASIARVSEISLPPPLCCTHSLV